MDFGLIEHLQIKQLNLLLALSLILWWDIHILGFSQKMYLKEYKKTKDMLVLSKWIKQDGSKEKHTNFTVVPNVKLGSESLRDTVK
jgi:hypothetical protein